MTTCALQATLSEVGAWFFGRHAQIDGRGSVQRARLTVVEMHRTRRAAAVGQTAVRRYFGKGPAGSGVAIRSDGIAADIAKSWAGTGLPVK